MRFAILSCNIIQLLAIGTHRFSFALTQTERLVHAVTCMLTALLLATVFEQFAARSRFLYRATALLTLTVIGAELICVASKAFTGAWTQREILVLSLLGTIAAAAVIKRSLNRTPLTEP